MIIQHVQVGDVSKTVIDFGDREPSDEDMRRARALLGLADEACEPDKSVEPPNVEL